MEASHPPRSGEKLSSYGFSAGEEKSKEPLEFITSPQSDLSRDTYQGNQGKWSVSAFHQFLLVQSKNLKQNFRMK